MKCTKSAVVCKIKGSPKPQKRQFCPFQTYLINVSTTLHVMFGSHVYELTFLSGAGVVGRTELQSETT